MAWIQLVPPAAVTLTVTLPGGAAAMALFDGCGGLGSPLPCGDWLGVGVVVVALGVASALVLSSPPLPETRLGADAPLGLVQRRHRRGRLGAALLGRVLRDQRFRIEPHGARDAADVAARVHVAAATREVVLLDPLEDRDAYPGAGADLVDGQPRFDAGLGEGTTDRRAVVGGRVADGHEGAFRACSHLLEVQSRGGRERGSNRRAVFVRHSGRPTCPGAVPGRRANRPRTGVDDRAARKVAPGRG
jgi:hypothetical protein